MTHVKVTVTVQSPHNPEQVFSQMVLVRDDLLNMEPSRRNDAAQTITQQRVLEAFIRAYHAACHSPE